MTGRGLFNALKAYPDEVHLLEDMEQIVHDRGAQGVLRSALWAQGDANPHGRYERLVTWATHLKEHDTIFTGGIILLANRPLADVPELEAIKTRIGYFELNLSAPETIAMMRLISLRGFRHAWLEMSPAECSEVCEFVVANSLELERGLDLRLLVNSFKDYLQWQESKSGCTWQDLVLTRIKERPIGIKGFLTTEGQSDRRRAELETALEIRDLPPEDRARVWKERTGKSVPTFYRRLKELGEK